MGTNAQGWGLPRPQAARFGLARLCKRRGCSSLPPFFPTIYKKKKKSHCCSLSLSNAGGSVNSRKGWRPQDAAPSSPGVLGEKPVVLGSNFVPVRRQRIVCQRFEFVGFFFFFRCQRVGEEHVQTVQRSAEYCFISGQKSNEKRGKKKKQKTNKNHNQNQHAVFHQKNAVDPKRHDTKNNNEESKP